MDNEFLRKLADKSLTKDELRQKVEQDFNLLPILLEGVSSPKTAVRYGCAKILMDISDAHPEKLYQYIDAFVELLESKYRILTWNAIAIIANLARVDRDQKFDAVFDKYYTLLNNQYMVTVANIVGSSGKIALSKPYLIPKITEKLLTIENISLTPHLTEECKRVIAEKTIASFDMFFEKIDQKERVFSFVEKQLNSPRRTLRIQAENFLKKWHQASREKRG